jgi:type II secretory pathway predicted ATPase ExeA
MRRQLQALYGLKWNPFLPDVPTEALFATPRVQSFWERLRQLTASGGYGLLTGEPGTGKSAALRLIKRSLEGIPDVAVGVVTRPQSTVSEFYRELGDLFGMRLSPCNRWGGAKALRDRWVEHCENSKLRPVLIIDEAQETRVDVLSEIRLLASYMLDSQLLLLVVLAGDQRLVERLTTPDLLPLASRIRVRIALVQQTPEEMRALLEHLLDESGASRLFADEVKSLLGSHAGGNLRAMMNMGAELLEAALAQEVARIDERFFFAHFTSLSQTRDADVVRRRSR